MYNAPNIKTSDKQPSFYKEEREKKLLEFDY